MRKGKRLSLWFLLIPLFTIVIAAVTAFWLSVLAPARHITKENCARMQDGMTLAEVEVVLGGPGKVLTSFGEKSHLVWMYGSKHIFVSLIGTACTWLTFSTSMTTRGLSGFLPRSG
jgi:hypothetical protein